MGLRNKGARDQVEGWGIRREDDGTNAKRHSSGVADPSFTHPDLSGEVLLKPVSVRPDLIGLIRAPCFVGINQREHTRLASLVRRPAKSIKRLSVTRGSPSLSLVVQRLQRDAEGQTRDVCAPKLPVAATATSPCRLGHYPSW